MLPRACRLIAAALVAGLAASAARGAGRCGEDPERRVCTGDVDFSSFGLVTEPLLPTAAGATRLQGRFRAVPLGPEGTCQTVWLWDREPGLQGPRIELHARRVTDVCLGPELGEPAAEQPAEEEAIRWELGVLAPRVYDVQVRQAPAQYFRVPYRFEVLPATPWLELADGDFVAVLTHGQAPVPATSAVALTDLSGTFAFFSPSNIEVTLKILDGRALNGHYWVFAASLTDLPFTLTVFDNRTGCLEQEITPVELCPTKAYIATGGQNRNFIDTAAFPAGD